MTSRSAKSAGFTLIELMIAVAVFAALLALGLPSFQQLLKNYQVRVAAESVANGVQRARAEAVSRNSTIQFVLQGGTSWNVDYAVAANRGPNPIDSRLSTEGSANVVLAAVAADLATAATTITFNNLGQVAANADASPALSQITFNATASGANQILRVKIGAGGNTRVCDPSLPSTNVRYCP
ncbi:MAG TPA: GspH/FimT family pseudopilin [Burkholderiales bacterium]|nr:GspH/FimT family pseudopilin [Burkholderiales bacterium]